MNKNINSKKSLEQNVFQDDLDFKVFQDILDSLDGIQAIFISRKKWNLKKGNFLEKNKDKNSQKQYTLYLPKDLKINELPSIIYKINKFTFQEKMPVYASSNELKTQIVFAIDTLCKTLNKKNITPKFIKKAIKNYIRLYARIFWDKEAQQLNNIDYRKGILDNRNINKFKSYEKNIVKVQTQEDLNKLQLNINNTLAEQIKSHFFESFFERWVNKLWIGMMTITWAEQKKLDILEKQRWNLIYKHINNENLDKKERLLREKIGIDNLKKKLKVVREKGNPTEIAQEELNATNTIIYNIYEYPYQKTRNDYGYQPSKILENKELYCIWFSLLWHAFLSELWIKHKWLTMPSHTALKVLIWKESYYFDAVALDKIVKMQAEKNIWEYTKWKLPPDYELSIDIIAKDGNPENILLSEIYQNKAVSLMEKWELDRAWNLLNKAIKLVPKLATAYDNLGNILYKKWKWKKSIDYHNKALSLIPNTALFLSNKWLALAHLAKYEEAISCYDEAIQSEPNNPVWYTRKWNFLGEILWQYGKALVLYNKALELEPNNPGFLFNKWNALANLNKNKEAILCYNKAIELDSNNPTYWRNKWLALSNLEQYKEAILCFNKAIQLNPNNPDYYYDKWNNLHNLNEDKQAIDCFDKAIQLNPNNPAYYINKWIILGISDKYKEAIFSFKKVLELDPTNWLIYLYIWEIFEVLGKGKIWWLYKYIWTFLQWNSPNIENLDNQNISIINNFLKTWDLERLNIFISEIEEGKNVY